MPDAFSQTVGFDVSVERLFHAIADSAEHSAFTGAPAEMPGDAGESFSTHGGAIEGWMLEAVPNKLLVQAWRPADWPTGVYSLVRYEFKGTDQGAEITLTHSGLPAEGSEHLAEGWEQRYWGPLANYLEGS